MNFMDSGGHRPGLEGHPGHIGHHHGAQGPPPNCVHEGLASTQGCGLRVEVNPFSFPEFGILLFLVQLSSS